METKLLKYAIWLLGRRQYSVAEMQKKLSVYLLKRKIPEISEEGINRVEQLMAKLQKQNLLDDSKYAGQLISAALRRKPQGLTALKKNLKQKGIAADTVSASIKDAQVDEKLYARRAAAKKLKLLRGVPADSQKEKLIRFLAARGFSSSTIYSIIGEIPARATD